MSPVRRQSVAHLNSVGDRVVTQRPKHLTYWFIMSYIVRIELIKLFDIYKC